MYFDFSHAVLFHPIVKCVTFLISYSATAANFPPKKSKTNNSLIQANFFEWKLVGLSYKYKTNLAMADDVLRVSGRVRKRSARLADFEDLNDSDLNNKRPR